MGLGRGKTEHVGARDMTRKHGHWGFAEEAKAWATRARRRDEREELDRALAETRTVNDHEHQGDEAEQTEPEPGQSRDSQCSSKVQQPHRPSAT
jgi:hypothetical protein